VLPDEPLCKVETTGGRSSPEKNARTEVAALCASRGYVIKSPAASQQKFPPHPANNGPNLTVTLRIGSYFFLHGGTMRARAPFIIRHRDFAIPRGFLASLCQSHEFLPFREQDRVRRFNNVS
jgi:hypothetical protein